MNLSLIDKWVEALRSGQYMQCKGDYALLNEYGDVEYCALGVLMDVANREGCGDFDPFNATDYTIDGILTVLDSDPYDFDLSEVIDWNDSQGFSFTAIATKLEECYGANKE